MISRSGIYKITCTANGKFYIGSAVNFKARWAIHTSSVEKGSHHSRHMQRAWNKYGEVAFKFEVLLLCAKEDLIMYEQRAIDVSKPAFNMSPTAGSTLGLKHTPAQCMANSKRCKVLHNTPEAKARMSARSKAYFSDPLAREKHSAKTKARLANTPKEVLRAKYTPEVKQKLKLSAQGRAELYVVCGEQLAAREIEARYGVGCIVFRRRLRSGWSLDDAATTPPDKKHSAKGSRTHEYNGTLYTLAELLPFAHCTKTALWRRLKAGLTVAQAVEMTPEQAETWRCARITQGNEGRYTPEWKEKVQTGRRAAADKNAQKFSVHGEALTVAQILKKYSLKRNTFLGRLQRGWSVECAVTQTVDTTKATKKKGVV